MKVLYEARFSQPLRPRVMRSIRKSARDRPRGGTTRLRMVPRIPSDTHHVAATLSTTYGSTNPATRCYLEHLTNNGPLRKSTFWIRKILSQSWSARDISFL